MLHYVIRLGGLQIIMFAADPFYFFFPRLSGRRPASRLGGISSYTVGRRVEILLEHLKRAVTGGMQLDACQGRRQLKYEGELNEEQAEVLRMRFDLQHSFEEIAVALKLPQGYIQKVFVQARLQLRRGGG